MITTHNTASAENCGEGGGREGGGRGEGEGGRERQYSTHITAMRAVWSPTFSNMAIFLSRERGSMMANMVTTLIREVLMAQPRGSVSANTTRQNITQVIT